MASRLVDISIEVILSKMLIVPTNITAMKSAPSSGNADHGTCANVSVHGGAKARAEGIVNIQRWAWASAMGMRNIRSTM